MIAPFVQWIVAAAAIVTAAATTGTFAAALAVWRLVKQHERTLHGSQQNDAWNGLIQMVTTHREALEEEGTL
ncbi:hypothetical protein [Halorubrum sp. DTA46]|uniref:hypothetical protein n=1 Tax=Halorubrum sp. DTA46 TaxID=3402162 RepID=UPI003AAF05AD